MKVFFRISARQKEREALSGHEFHWPIRKDAGHQCKYVVRRLNSSRFEGSPRRNRIVRYGHETEANETLKT